MTPKELLPIKNQWDWPTTELIDNANSRSCRKSAITDSFGSRSSSPIPQSMKKRVVKGFSWLEMVFCYSLSGGFWVRPAQRKVVKVNFSDISYRASSTPWGHVLSLKNFCRNTALSWAIRYSVFQKVKSTSSFEFVCCNPFSTFWHLMVKSG